jgi:hypothetical protein
MSLRIVCTGKWLYDGTVEKPVDIIALEYDWWYSLAYEDNQLEDGEEPTPIGPDGCLYYARFQRALDTSESTWVDSPGYQQLSDAMAAAENKVVGEIQWHV